MEKINKIKIKIILLLATCYLSLVAAPMVSAATLSLSVNPPIIEIKAIPPTTVVSSLNIQNKGDAQTTLQIQFKPFETKGENGELVYSKEALGIFKNIQILDDGVPVEDITLGPQQEKSLNLNIIIPPDTDISDYYFSVIFVSINSSPVASNSSTNRVGIATNVLLSVGPREIPKASIEEFSTNIFLEKGPVPFTIRVKNAGIHLIKPKGEITIKNMLNQSVGKFDLTSVNVLSNSIRAIPNKTFSNFKHPLAVWKESFLLGFYAATLNILISDTGPTFTRTIYFFAFPFQALIIIVTIAIAVIVVRNKLKLRINKDRT